MIWLSKLLLINWHNINKEVMEFSRVNFLTGPTGSGKSTSIDALQILLLGRTDNGFFNKAAAAKSEKKREEKRSLKGYLYNRIGAARDEEKQDEMYKRQACFSSYIVAEFKEIIHEKETAHFCFGAVFDCSYPDDPTKRFFYLKGRLPENCFIENDIPTPGYELAKYMKERFDKRNFEVFSSEQLYRLALRRSLGNLKERFHDQFRRAVPFDPSIDLEKFLSDFACDVDTAIDIAPMQESVAYYNELQLAAKDVSSQITSLTDICSNYEKYRENATKAQLYQYVFDRGQADAAAIKLQQTTEFITTSAQQIVQQEDTLVQYGKEAADSELAAETARMLFYQEKANVNQREKEIENEIKRNEQEEDRIEAAKKGLQGKITEHKEHWQRIRTAVQVMNNQCNKVLPATIEIDQAIAQQIGDEMRLMQAYESNLAKWIALLEQPITTDEFKTTFLRNKAWSAQMASIGAMTKHANEISSLMKEIKRRQNGKREELEENIALLKQGIKLLPPEYRMFIDDLSFAMGATTNTGDIRFVGDCLEVKDIEWQNAIEGYLGRRRFHVLVPPEQHQAAIVAYKRLKQEKRYYGIGIIDTARILKERQQVLRGSLAEELETGDPCAQAYIEYVLGRVMKAERVETMQQYRTAMTKDCWRYQGYVREPLKPETFRDLYIGRKAMQIRLEKANVELSDIKRRQESMTAFGDAAACVAVHKELTQNDMESIQMTLNEMALLVVLRDQRMQLVLEKGNIDKTNLIRLESEKDNFEQIVKECYSRKNKFEIELEKLKEKNETARADLPQLVNENADKLSIISKYDVDWAAFEGQPYYNNCLERIKDPLQTAQNYKSQVSQFTNLRDEFLKEVHTLRFQYAQNHPAAASGLDMMTTNNDEWATEEKRLRESALPDYQERIERAKNRAYEQFQNDFLSRLYKNIASARQQIKELSDALKEVSFGSGIRFKLRTEVNKKYTAYYDMIMDESLLQGQNMFAPVFQEKHGNVFNEFFDRFIPPDDEKLTSNQVRDIANDTLKLTDYRTYLDFEMEEIQPHGPIISLTRSGGLRSGGEGQTVFYVSVLASFMKLYRVKNPANNHTFRLVVFDEAFSKMDRTRISDSMTWLKETGLQVLIAAPPDKMVEIQPHVDCTFIVSKSNEETIIIPAQYQGGEV